jgi:proteasome alpha subunit
LEGFNRSPEDVTLRRLIGFALSPSMKNSFEQIFSPPIMVEAIFAELGASPEMDILVRIHFDGNHHYESSGVLVAYTDPKREKEAQEWLTQNLKAKDSLAAVANICYAAWRTLTDDKPFAELKASENELPAKLNGKVVEAALLDRKATSHVHYRTLSLAQLKA